MKKDNKMKMRSLLVAILMIASAMFVFVVKDVKAAPLSGAPEAFSISGISGTSSGSVSKYNTTAGMSVYGQVRIDWGASSIQGASSGDIRVGYNVSIAIAPVHEGHGQASWYESVGGGNATHYLWNTTQWADGTYYINVTAINVTDGTATRTMTNATNGPMKVEVRNNVRGTPGVDLWRGANYSVHSGTNNARGFASNELKVFSVVTVDGTGTATAGQISLEAGDRVNITIDSVYGANLSTTDYAQYYLFYPVYNGSERGVEADHDLRWKRVKDNVVITPTTDYQMGHETGGLYLTDDGTSSGRPVAGMWVINDKFTSDGTNYWTDVDCSNASNFNASVPIWFWVNTSTDYTVTPSETTWAYNASGSITLSVKDSSVSVTGSTIDIRRKSNDSSIYNGNLEQSSATPLTWYKNNSYGGLALRHLYGFLSVGNYTARAYYDADWWGAAGSQEQVNGHTKYLLKTNMGTSTGGFYHYNNTWGSNANKNGSDSWLSGAERYNWMYCGPWDPPEYNATMQTIRVTTGTPTISIPTANQTMYFDFPGEVNVSIAELPSGAYLDKVNVSVVNEQGVNVTANFVLVTQSDSSATGTSRNNIGAEASTGRGIIDVANITKGYIRINHSSWGKDTDGHAGLKDGSTLFGRNGTWTVKIYSDVAPTVGDRSLNGGNKAWTEEWNTSITFQVASATGRLIFTMIDDDGNITGGTDTDGVIRRVPKDTKYGGYSYETPVEIQFKIENEQHKYMGSYSGGQTDAMKNITISGDALFLEDGSLTLTNYPELMRSYLGGTWTIRMIPVMNINGGTITIAIDWGPFGTHTETITIGGIGVNGTIVEMSPATFTFGANVTLTATVKHPATGAALTGGTVTWYWLRDDGGLGDKILTTGTPDTAGGNTYSFNFNTTMQSAWQVNSSSMNGWGTTNPNSIKAPRNITAYANVTNIGYGYARTKMDAIKDLKVTVYPSEVMAGRAIPARSGGGYQLYFNVTTIDSSGNFTGRPANVASTSFAVKIYNASGGDVTDKIGSIASGDLDDSVNNYNYSLIPYLREPGVYTVHAYNNTHKSWGSYNATLTVTAVEVTCEIDGDAGTTNDYFIWGVDKNISATFTATYQGQPINNSGFTDYLRIDNVSKKGSGTTQYNKTWANSSFSWGFRAAGADATGLNASTAVSKSSGGFVNGVVKINDITANSLDEKLDDIALIQPSERRITFKYKHGDSGSVYANCTGVVLVKIPDVAASPAAIPYNEAAELMLTVTGRGVGLGNVRVNITVPGMTAFAGAQTNNDGVVVFAFTPPTIGDITIRIENRTSSVKVPVTLWSLYVDVPSQVNEGESFTVTIRNGSATGAGVAGATITFNKNIYTTGTDGTRIIPATDVPTVTANREFPIVATKTGHAEDSDTITVLNVPILSVVAPSTVTAESTFDVVVADDVGNAIIGATVALDGTTYTSGAQGIAKVTAPSAGTYTITASKTGFTTSDPVTITVEKKEEGIPGFELLTLIAAIGVAFILLRRRRH